MDVLKEYEELQKHTKFREFSRENKDYYLVHILVPENAEQLEIGFFNPKNDKITIFKTNPVTQGKEEDVFKEGKTIAKLDINKIKVNYAEANEKAHQIIKQDHSAEFPNKKIIILQTISEHVWNMTFICKSLNIINIRIDAETGKIIRNNKSSLLSMAGMGK